jgi:hypothetical protein
LSNARCDCDQVLLRVVKGIGYWCGHVVDVSLNNEVLVTRNVRL